MADFNEDREEVLRRTSHAVTDMLRQLKAAKINAEQRNQDQQNRGRGRGRSSQHQPGYHRGRGNRRGRGRGRGQYFGQYEPQREPQQQTRTYGDMPHQNWYRHQRELQEQSRSYRDMSPQNWRNEPAEQNLSPQDLVRILAEYTDMSASLLSLLEDRNLHPSVVRSCVTSNSSVFSLSNEIVKMQLKISICTAHCGVEGCQNRSTCQNLHICPAFVRSHCSEEGCVLGHRWHTNHNDSVLKLNFLQNLPDGKLFQLLRTFGKNSVDRPLDICSEYNDNGCKDKECSALHICFSFVAGLTKCSLTECDLNHNILNKPCRELLMSHGLPTNETPRDIIVALIESNPSLAKIKESQLTTDKVRHLSRTSEQDFKAEDSGIEVTASSRKLKKSGLVSIIKKQNTRAKHSAKGYGTDSGSDSRMSSGSNDDSDSDERSASQHRRKINSLKSQRKSVEVDSVDVNARRKSDKRVEAGNEGQNTAKKEHNRTLWSHYLQGDVPVAEICYDSVESMCKHEPTGCQRLHSTQHFHWQMKDQGCGWLNLRPDQVTCLERSFCDPKQEEVDLPRLNPAELESSVSGLLIRMGRDVWKANFKNMSLSNSSKTKTFNLRRLYTENVSGQIIKPCTFLWYFFDIKQNWIEYGKADSTGSSHLVSRVTSADIENQFCQNALGSFSFQNAKFAYTLDFQTMMQTNNNTRTSREVRRRPQPHLANERNVNSIQQGISSIPSNWEAMLPKERMRLVDLLPTDSEYQTVLRLLNGRVSTSNVVKIQRIQNPYLWNAFQNKVKELTTIYGDASKVNIRQLFHGTNASVVSNICAENFDWRLHGSASGQAYGRGTYFATEASTSYGYCRPDASGLRFLFVARTAVGSMTNGNSSIVRPPINPATNAPFDSTVNALPNPSIIVKYDKQEYYPEYLFTLR